MTGLADGAHRLGVVALDEHQNLSVAETAFTVDTVAPDITISGVTPGFTYPTGAAYHDMSALCTGTGANWRWTPPANLTPGTYYTTCSIHITGANITGRATFISEGTIKVSGANTTLTAFADGLLFLAGANDQAAVAVSGSGHTLTGAVVAPNGGYTLSGANHRIRGGVIATTITITGSNHYITAQSGLLIPP